MDFEFWITSHVVLDLKEVLAVIAALEARYRTIATLQYGAGLRLKELVRLRVKDIDLKRGIVTIHREKGVRSPLDKLMVECSEFAERDSRIPPARIRKSHKSHPPPRLSHPEMIPQK